MNSAFAKLVSVDVRLAIVALANQNVADRALANWWQQCLRFVAAFLRHTLIAEHFCLESIEIFG